MRLFLTGATGLIGRYLIESNPKPTEHLIYGVSKEARPEKSIPGLQHLASIPFDDAVRDPSKMLQALREFKPDVVIHAGAEGNLDQVEQDPKLARAINLEFPLWLNDQTTRLGIPLVHFSSSTVYAGTKAPYSESDPALPPSTYGKLKAEVDQTLRQRKVPWAIVRPSITYGWNHPFGRSNPATRFLEALSRGEHVRVVTDMIENPIYAGDVAQVLWTLIDQAKWGEYNLGGGDQKLSRYDWIVLAAKQFGIDPRAVLPAKVQDFNPIAPRAIDLRMTTDRVTQLLGNSPLTAQQGLQKMWEDKRRHPQWLKTSQDGPTR